MLWVSQPVPQPELEIQAAVILRALAAYHPLVIRLKGYRDFTCQAFPPVIYLPSDSPSGPHNNFLVLPRFPS